MFRSAERPPLPDPKPDLTGYEFMVKLSQIVVGQGGEGEDPGQEIQSLFTDHQQPAGSGAERGELTGGSLHPGRVRKGLSA